MTYLYRAFVVLALVCAVGPAFGQRTTIADLEKQVAALEAELAKLAAEAPTVASSVADVTARLERLEEQLATARREQQSVPQAIAKLETLDRKVGTLATDIEELRTRLGNLESPAEVVGGGAGVTWNPGSGFRWRSADGSKSVFIGGLGQFRLDSAFRENVRGHFTAEAGSGGYSFRRTWLYTGGAIGPFEADLLADPRLEGALLEYRIAAPAIKLWGMKVGASVGQFRAPFTRSFMTWAGNYVFVDRPAAVDNLRYDRSPGIEVHSSFLGDQLYVQLASTNGSGRNSINDNRELATFVRAEASIFGPRPKYGYGDVDHSEDPVLVIGAGFAHELSQVPSSIAGIEVGERDVDADEELDNLRILSATADLLFRWRGFELAAEGIFRREDWGTVFDHPDNLEVGELFEYDDKRNYIGIYGDVSYVWNRRYLFGARVGHHRQAPFQTDARGLDQAPTSVRLLEAAAVARLRLPKYEQRWFGLTYRYRNANNDDFPEVANDESHEILLDFQLAL